MTHGAIVVVNNTAFEGLRLELRRGCLVLAVLSALREEQYGYTLRKTLVELGLPMEESTLYPLLRRLETQGLLSSEWREEEKRNRRFYQVTSEGRLVLEQLLGEWQRIDSSLKAILEEKLYGTR